jgi:hypothetical protein
MNSLPTELIYVLAFAAFALVQYLLQRFRTSEQLDATPPKEALETLDDEVKESPIASVHQLVSVDDLDRSKTSSAPTAPARSRFAMASILGNKRDVQNAIVIATIVGRCRAYEPHDVR